MKTTAIYTGSFDPPTKGHLWMIEQVVKMFGNVVVAIGINPDKTPMFRLEERIEMLKAMTEHLPNVSTEGFKGLAVTFAKSKDAKDFEYEETMRSVNAIIDPEIESVFLIPPPELAEVSSSLVRSIMNIEGWENAIGKFVPEAISAKIKELKQ